MSILNYFKQSPKGNSSKENFQLLDLHGPLCASVPSSVIKGANGQVMEVLTAPATRGLYCIR